VAGVFQAMLAPVALLRAAARAGADPRAAGAAVAVATRAPLARRAPAVAALCAARIAESPLGAGALLPATGRTAAFAQHFHNGYRSFKQLAPLTWQDALDPTAVHPAFSIPFAAAVTLLSGVPLGVAGTPALTAAVDALAHLEFARVADPRYATLLRDVAGAMGGDDEASEALATAVVVDLFPDIAELDAPTASSSFYPDGRGGGDGGSGEGGSGGGWGGGGGGGELGCAW